MRTAYLAHGPRRDRPYVVFIQPEIADELRRKALIHMVMAVTHGHNAYNVVMAAITICKPLVRLFGGVLGCRSAGVEFESSHSMCPHKINHPVPHMKFPENVSVRCCRLNNVRREHVRRSVSAISATSSDRGGHPGRASALSLPASEMLSARSGGGCKTPRWS